MSQSPYFIADYDFAYHTPSDGSDANSGYMVINGTTFRIMQQRTPTNDVGYVGEICYDSTNFYICVQDSPSIVWKKLALTDL